MKRELLLLLFALFLSVFTYGQQLSENFDGATFPPDDWALETGSGDWDQSNETADHTTGSDYFARYDCWNINGTDPAYLITPKLDVTSGDQTFSFWANYYFISGSYGNSAELYVDVSDDNGATWTSGTTNYISGQEGAGWFQVSIDLGNFEGQNFVGSTVKVRFKAISDYGSYNIAVDDVSGPAIHVDACPDPSGQTVSNITTTGADLGWTDASGSHWDIYIVPTGDPVPTQSTTPTVNDYTSTSYTWSGGTANTTYDWYVRSDCGQDNTNTSAWVGPSTFTTQCNPINTFPYSEDFSSWEPSCWTIDKNITGSTYEWTQYSSGGVECAEAGFWGQSGGNTDIMYTPKFDVSGLTTPSFYFKWSHKFSSSYPDDSLSVEVSDDNGNTWHQVWTKGGSNLNSNDGAGNTAPGSFVQTADIDLSSYGNSIIIRFFAYSGYGPDLFVDDVTVREMPSCPDPTNQTVSNITTTGADLGWTDGSGSHWDIYIVPTGDPAPTQSTTPTVNDYASTSYTWTGGSSSTTYDWYVRSDCDQNNTGTSTWVGPSTFTTLNVVNSYPYTESFETDFGLWSQATDDDMDWTRNSGSTPSSNTGPSAASDGSYYIYTEASGNSNKQAILSLVFDFTSLTTPYFTFDYHMYGADMGILSIDASTDNGANWTSLWSKSGDQGNQWNTANITMSGYGGNSNVYIRINGTTGNGYTSDMAVDNIVVEEAPSCPAPTDLTVSNLTSSTADLDWTENGSATTWEIMIDTTGFDTTGYSHTSTTTKPYHVTGLSSSTSYDWYVRSSCGGGDYSDWVGPNTFYTTPVNDNCSDAITLTVGYDTTYVVGTNVGATDSNNNPDPIPAPGCGSYNGGDVWFTATVPSSGYLKLTAKTFSGSSLTDGAMAYYTGSCGSLTLGSCNDDGGPGTMPEITINDVNLAGETIYVRFWEYGNNSFGKFYIGATTAPTAAVWDGSTDNNWFDRTNWDVNGVPGEITVVTIPPGLTNYPTLTSSADVKDLTIQSTSSGDGSLIGGSYINASGDITVQRYVAKGQWHDIGVSVQNQTLNTYYFNHNPDVWVTKYNESDDSRTYLTDLNEALNPGYGNEIWVDANYSSDGVTINMTGPFVSGDVSPTLSFTDATHGYNLIANPYSSAIDLDNITALTNVDTQFWVWKPNTSGGGSYYDWNSTSGAGALTDGIVPMGQGFFVHANAASPAITIPASAAVHSSQAYYKNNGKEQEKITLVSTGDDQLNILFIDGATEQYEAYDTKKMFSMSEITPQIFSEADNVMLSLNSLPVLNNDDERIIPVGFIPGTEEGIKTITADITLPDDVEVILEDTKLNVFQDLKADNIYRFAATQDDEPMRFLLHVGRNVTGIGNNDATTNLNVYGFNNNIYILSNGEMANQTKQVEVYDVMGRRIINKEFAPSKMDVIPVGKYDSYLIVRIISGGEVYTHKLFVK